MICPVDSVIRLLNNSTGASSEVSKQFKNLPCIPVFIASLSEIEIQEII